MLAVLILDYGGSELSVACVGSLLPLLPADASVWILDNGSEAGRRLLDRPEVRAWPARVHVQVSAGNLGFAGGMNRLLAQVLADPDVRQVLLLNNDMRFDRPFIPAMRACLAADPAAGMVAARMIQVGNPEAVDSLGITLYRSGLASNRKRPDERLLGPTGGCMLLDRRLLDDLEATHGEWFDERFFCYAEDTDLVMRARWLGYETAYADDAVVMHHGSLSSGGPDNEFVLYHGIRNSIWALAKNAPALWLLAHLPWILAAHAGIWLRNLRKGRWRTLCRLYCHAMVGLPAMLRKRARIRRSRRVPPRRWWSWVEPSLYERDYLRRAWAELFRRAR